MELILTIIFITQQLDPDWLPKLKYVRSHIIIALPAHSSNVKSPSFRRIWVVCYLQSKQISICWRNDLADFLDLWFLSLKVWKYLLFALSNINTWPQIMCSYCPWSSFLDWILLLSPLSARFGGDAKETKTTTPSYKLSYLRTDLT